MPGISVWQAQADLWLRGDELTDELEFELRKLPGAQQYMVGEDETITPMGRLVPVGSLPSAHWQPIAKWFLPAPQPAAMAGQVVDKAAVRLVRSSVPKPANVLLTTLDVWVRWATNAPQVRLRPLMFAVSAEATVIVRGEPLPGISGQRSVESAGVAVPAGLELEPALETASIRLLLQTESTELALISADGSWQRIGGEDFVRATRAAARATAVGIKGDEDALKQDEA